MPNKRKSINSVDRAFDVIEFLRDAGSASFSDVANGLGLPKGTTHRHLETLIERGYIVKDEGKYRLGLPFLELGTTARRFRPEYKLVREKVADLAATTNERVQFMVEENGRSVYVYQKMGENAVETDTYPGKRVPLHASAAGLAILAELPEDRVETILDEQGLEAYTNETITDRDTLYGTLRQTRDRGYSINDQGIVEGLRALGSSIRGPDGDILGALSISGPINRMRGDRFDDELPDLLLGATNELELRIAYQ